MRRENGEHSSKFDLIWVRLDADSDSFMVSGAMRMAMTAKKPWLEKAPSR